MQLATYPRQDGEDGSE